MRRLRPRTVADIPRYLLAQYNREELYQQVWQEPMQLLAKRYGVSDVALAKTCRKLLIPLPGLLGKEGSREAGTATTEDGAVDLDL